MNDTSNDITLKTLRRFLPESYCNRRANTVGCYYRHGMSRAKLGDKIGFGCEDCLSLELDRRHSLRESRAMLVERVTWHYQSLVSRFHRGKHFDLLGFIRWKVALNRIDEIYAAEIDFIMNRASKEWIGNRLNREMARIDREARKAEREGADET